MKKRNILILFCIVASLVYFFLVPVPAKRERSLSVDWHITLTPENAFTGVASQPESAPGFTPLLLDDYLCYISEEGEIGYAETRLKRAALEDEYFINYSSVPERLIIKKSDGTIIAAVDTRGYPLIQSGRLFVLHQDRCGLSEYTPDGELIWSKRFASMITSFDGTEQITALGLLDGRLIVINSEGRGLHIETFQGGKYNTIYGCAADETGTKLAAIVGIGPQRFVVFDKIEGEYELILSEVLETDYRRECFVDFVDSGLIVYEQEGFLQVFDPDRTRNLALPLQGRAVDVHYDAQEHLIYVAAAAGNGAVLSCYETTGRKLAEYRFPGTVRLTAHEGGLILTNGNSVFRVTLRKT